MSISKSLRYQIRQIELQRPLEAMVVPEDCGGLAFVIRLNDQPVGYFMEALPPGTRLEPQDIAERAIRNTGKQILSERIYGELRGALDVSAFPSLDVAICTHGRPDALARCLDSLRRLGFLQAPGQIQVLVVDNAPPDGRTAELVRQYPSVAYVVEPKPGLDFARNRAIHEARGELLAFLDDDVVVDRSWLAGLREAWAANPDAAAFTGPILPLELETKAQVVFERIGGFGKNFERVRFGAVWPESATYPCGAGIFGAGANMVFRRSVLEQLGGFDEALDTGAPLPGGGDLDMFYRIVRAGYPLIREPKLLVYHQHRREYKQLRHQMWTWGLGTGAYLVKSWRSDPSQRPVILRWILWWLCFQLAKAFVPFLRRSRVGSPWDLVFAEILGGIVGLCGEYDRSIARVKRLGSQHARVAPAVLPPVLTERGRWQAISIELTEPLPELCGNPSYDGVRAVFFWNGVALGHARFEREELPLSPCHLANAAAKAIAPAVGDHVLAEGFRSALPGLPEPPLEDPVQALRSLVNLEEPIAEMKELVTAPGPKPRATLSVAICTHERPEELSCCLTSLTRSEEQPDEILVIDNAPCSDATREVVARFAGVRYYCEPTKGLSAARNAALALASGDIVAFADDDVWVHPQWAARIRRCFDTPSVMAATGLVLPAELETPAQSMFENFQFFHQGYRRRYFDAEYFAALHHKGVPVWSIGAGANMAIRRRAFELGYDFDTRLGPGVFGGCGEDSEFWYRLLAEGWSCVYDPSACVFHYHRRDLGALRRQVRQYMQGHVAALVIQFRKFGYPGNLRRLLLELPAEYCLLLLRLLVTGFAPDHRILLRGVLGCFSGLRAVLHRGVLHRSQAGLPAK